MVTVSSCSSSGNNENVDDSETKNELPKKITSMSYETYEYDDSISVYVYLENEYGGYVYEAASVDIRIVDDFGKVLYENTIGISKEKRNFEIKYSDLAYGTTNDGTIYLKVYGDGFSFEETSKKVEKLPWTVTVELPNIPKTISSYYSNNSINSSCKVSEISYEIIYGDSLKFYFTGEKTYDDEGNNHSESCKIGWKLYDSEGYVIDDGICYTNSLKTGEKFKKTEDYAYDVIEQGKSYRLEIMGVN